MVIWFSRDLKSASELRIPNNISTETREVNYFPEVSAACPVCYYSFPSGLQLPGSKVCYQTSRLPDKNPFTDLLFCNVMSKGVSE